MGKGKKAKQLRRIGCFYRLLKYIVIHYSSVVINVGDSAEIVRIDVTKYTKGFTDIVSGNEGGKYSDKLIQQA